MDGESISKTFKIPISYLDYDHIKKCTNVSELEKIYLTLKTGEEGVYPDLEKFCEEHLKKLSPNSRALRKATELISLNQLDGSLKEEILTEFQSWVSDIKTVDKSLNISKPSNNGDGTSLRNFPIRNKQEISVDNKETLSSKSSNRSCKPKDYNEWSKIADLLEKQMVLEEKEELSKPQVLKSKTENQPPKYGNDLQFKVNTENMSQIEKDRVARLEKEKGNEAFKSGDLTEAVIHYTRSLSVLPIDAVYNNRGLVFMKEKKWEEAIRDLSLVLKNDPENIKALQRRATCYSEIHNLPDAIIDCRKILQLNPNNKFADKILSTSLKELESRNMPKLKDGKRMVITEIDSDEESTDDVNHEYVKENFVSVQTPVKEDKEKEIQIPGSGESEVTVQGQSEEEFIKLKEYGNQLFKELKYEEALCAYDKLVEKWPSNPIGYRNRAACNLVLQRSNDVIKDCTKAIELDKDSHLSYYRRGKAYKTLKMYEDSYKDLEMALVLSPGHNQIKDEFSEVKILLEEENISRRSAFLSEATEIDSTIRITPNEFKNTVIAGTEPTPVTDDIDEQGELIQDTSNTWEFLALPEPRLHEPTTILTEPIMVLKRSSIITKMTKYEFDKQLNNIRLQGDWVPTIQLLLDAGPANLSSCNIFYSKWRPTNELFSKTIFITFHQPLGNFGRAHRKISNWNQA